MAGFDNFLGMMLQGKTLEQCADRETALRKELGQHIVDTCLAYDTEKWETGIFREEEEKWFIVETYKNKAAATSGHKRWIKKIKANPKMKLVDNAFNEWLGR